MTNYFFKHETVSCILLIILYILINSFCINTFGIYSYKSTILNTIFSIFLIYIIKKTKRLNYYGFNKVTNPKKYLYFIPLICIVSVNFWNGININNSVKEIIFFILTMINVGFIEEIIFRGFIFKMVENSNVKLALFISAFSFGIGHIVNLFNGSFLIETIIQILYSISIGYLFVLIFYKSKSLIPCIITHILLNSLSIFNIENNTSLYLAPIFLIIVSLIYIFYISYKIKDKN